ncbi:MAG TPA: phenylalanine--tRNA ligase subunit alpha [Candidatus Thermoplasmatota archaeon]|nr:phenylalanine--tRNA ligase subunit alpha [Candidatus Thermoplasmatota archaeon]
MTTAELSNAEKKVLLAFQTLATEKATPEDLLAARDDFSALVEVMNGSSWLQAKGMVRHEETMRNFVALGREGQGYAEQGLPERRAVDYLARSGGKAPMSALVQAGALKQEEVSIALGWVKRKGLANLGKEGNETVLSLTEAGQRAATTPTADEAVLKIVAQRGEVPEGELDAEGLKLLYGRQNLVRKREEITRVIHLTQKGKLTLQKGEIRLTESVAQLTPELIQTGKWRDVEIRPYDVQAFAPAWVGGKKHPLRQIIDRIRQVFLEMGFSEIEGPYVRSAFWNMDALYTPQDHPARAMQDTFYLEGKLQYADLSPHQKLMADVRAVHENGGDTGSLGWRTPWSERVASQNLLRTHTTVDTINYLFKNPNPPVKVFSVDRVFRNEAVDATHLPEFHQVEGIVMEEGANLRQLIGLLRTFYAKMGFEKVTVRPSYYPYTEPSLDIAVWYNNRWLELGGAGIFRPEVTKPLGVNHPVLAWGLGLERLAMLSLGLKDLRELYVSDVEWLRNAPLQK